MNWVFVVKALNSFKTFVLEMVCGLLSVEVVYWPVCLVFRYTLSLPSDMQWGHIDENGTWNGLIGALNDRVRFTLKHTHTPTLTNSLMQGTDITVQELQPFMLTHAH